MDSVQRYDNNPIKKLMHRLGVSSDGVVLVHEHNSVQPRIVKFIYNRLKEATSLGTLCIFGSHQINSKVEGDTTLLGLSNQERILLASDKLLQLLVLEEETAFASHPSLMIGSIGKYSKFFARTSELDFPYGETSIFADFYDLNACVLFVHEGTEVPEACYASAINSRGVISRNTCIKDNDIVSYLDYECDEEAVVNALFASDLLLSETIQGVSIYGIRYRELIEFAKRLI